MTNILNLPAYRVEHVKETEYDYHVYAETIHPRMACTYGSHRVAGWGAHEQVIKDLPMHGKRVTLYVKTRRFRCEDCGKTGFESLPAVSDKRQMTTRLVQWVGQQSLERVFTSIAQEAGLDEKTVRNIFRDHVSELEAQFRFAPPKWLGIEEIHIFKARSVVLNIEQRSIVNLLPDRNELTVAAYLHSLEERDKINVVAIGIWGPYRAAVSAQLPHATVIVDKCHVLRLANAAIDKTRQKLRETLRPKERRGLMHDRQILLKREHELTAWERLMLENWSSTHQILGDAYRLKERFFGIFDAANGTDAQRLYDAWEASIPLRSRAAFVPLIRAWRNWGSEILAYFDHPITYAYTEGLNNLMRMTNRLGRGYSFEALRAKILFTEGVHKCVSSRPKWEIMATRHAGDGHFVQAMIGDASPGATDHGSTAEELEPANYGADISALCRWIETDRL
jgi:transposase